MPATATLAELHDVIQVVMEWDEDQLHAFTVGRRSYGDLDFAGDYDDGSAPSSPSCTPRRSRAAHPPHARRSRAGPCSAIPTEA